MKNFITRATIFNCTINFAKIVTEKFALYNVHTTGAWAKYRPNHIYHNGITVKIDGEWSKYELTEVLGPNAQIRSIFHEDKQFGSWYPLESYE